MSEDTNDEPVALRMTTKYATQSEFKEIQGKKLQMEVGRYFKVTCF